MKSSLYTQASAHSGRYGQFGKSGNVVYLDINCNKGSSPSNNKEVIFVVDLSLSMQESIPNLQSSLKAFRDAIINRTSNVKPTSIEIQKLDQEFRKKINVSLIGYSNDAQLIYSSEKSKTTWDDAIDNEIIAKNMTNMGAGIKLAFDITNSDKCTWIIVMSDGMSNKGDCIKKSDFDKLVKQSPKNTRILCMGYGSEFDSEILSSIGEFTHIESSEHIPVVFGSICNEICNTWGFNATSSTRGYKGDTTGFDCIIGDSKIGCLYNGRKYTIGLNIPNNFTEFVNNGKFVTKFIFVDLMAEGVIETKIQRSDKPPSEKHRELYYAASKGRRLKKLYNVAKDRNTHILKALCKTFRKQLGDWTEKCSLSHKQELLHVITEFENEMYDRVSLTALNRYTNMTTQSSNTDVGEFTSEQSQYVSQLRSQQITYETMSSGTNTDKIPYGNMDFS